MADFRKTIDIEVKADMKNLLAEFKKMPGMSQKEAKKMVSELSKNYKAAAREAKKAAAKQKAAMDKMTAANKRTASSSKSVRSQTREMGAAFGSLEDVVSDLNPELAGVAQTAGTVGQTFRSISRSLATGNHLVLLFIGGIAALAAVYTVLTSAQRTAKEAQENLEEATKRLNEKLQTQKNIAESVVSAHRNSALELAVFTGQVSQLDAQMQRARDTGADQIGKQLEKQDEIIKAQEKSISLVNKAKNSMISLTDEEEKELKILMASSEKQLVNQGLQSTSAGKKLQMVALQGELNKRLTVEQGFRAKIVKTGEDTVNNRIKLIKLQDELRRESQEEARRQESIAKSEAARKAKQAKEDADRRKKEAKEKADAAKEEQRLNKISSDIQKEIESSRVKTDALQISNRKLSISFLSDEQEKISETGKLEQEIIANKISGLEAEQARIIALAETEEQRLLAQQASQQLDLQIAEQKELAHLKEMQQSKERKKALDDEKKKRLDLINTIVSQSSEGASAVATIIENVSGENKKAAMLAFRINQAAAITNIAMTTAQKIMEVAPNPFAIAGVSALGALQAGVVASQPPPEFHMGGVIDKGEDTRNITVLTGEAVLDRRTVNRIGGDSGVAALQRGEMIGGPEVIVMNPFKHFDRYAKASSKRGGIMKNFSNTSASGVY